jgi:enoyl-CoA hydratase/carnithine racemase
MTSNHQAQPVLVTTESCILSIQLNRPEKKNAMTAAMYTALTEALEQAQRDVTVRVVLLSGVNGCFTSGNDLADFLENPPTDQDSPVFRFLRALSQAEKPVLAAVSGPAIGLGTTLLLHCDLIYADSSAMFQMPFINLGLCPEGGSSLLLPLRIGYQRSAELLFFGDAFDAQQALALGLINGVYDPDALMEIAWRKAEQLAAKPPASLRLSKALLKRGMAASVRETLALEGRHFIECLNSPEANEALQAFLERRKPDFSRFD